MKKQALAAILVVFLLFTATACKNGVEEEPTPPALTAEELAVLKTARQATMSEEQWGYYLTYIQPYEGGGLFTHALNTGGFRPEAEYGETTLFDLVGVDKLEGLHAEYGNAIPAEVVESLALARFQVAAEAVQKVAGVAYNAADRTYLYDKLVKLELYYGVVTQVSPGDWADIWVEGYHAQTGKFAYMARYTYEIQPDGSVLSLINDVKKMGEDETPYLPEHYDTLQLSIYNPKEKIYTISFQPKPENMSYGELLQLAAEEAGLKSFSFLRLREEKGNMVLDLSSEFVEKNLKTKEMQEGVLYSLASTLAMNEVYSLQITVDGGPYTWEGIRLEYNGTITPPELTMGTFTSEEFAAMRSRIPYKKQNMVIFDEEYIMPLLFLKDETQRPIAELLMAVGIPEYEEGGDPTKLSQNYILRAAINNTQSVILSRYYINDEAYIRDVTLLPIALAVEDEMFVLQEHVEQTAKQLFGEGVSIEHGDAFWAYHPVEGVYTPPHKGGGGVVIPYIHEVEVRGEDTVVTVSYAYMGYGLFGENGEDLTEDTLEAYQKTQAPRYKVVLGQHADGSYYFKSFQPLGS